LAVTIRELLILSDAFLRSLKYIMIFSDIIDIVERTIPIPIM